MAEWLGRGLQNLVQRFESASDLREKHYLGSAFFVCARSVKCGACGVRGEPLPLAMADMSLVQAPLTQPLLTSATHLHRSSKAPYSPLGQGCGDSIMFIARHKCLC